MPRSVPMHTVGDLRRLLDRFDENEELRVAAAPDVDPSFVNKLLCCFSRVETEADTCVILALGEMSDEVEGRVTFVDPDGVEVRPV